MQIRTCWTPGGRSWRPTRIESESSSLSRSLHAAWRNAVRTPWRNFRRRLRRALASSGAGVPVALDETTHLAPVPFEGRFPPPLVAVRGRRARTIPHADCIRSASIRRTTERVHYADHIVHAPAMTLEHLVDQYWFPAFGLLVSPEGASGATRSSCRFGTAICRRSRRSSTARGRTERAARLHLERLAGAPRIAGEHLLIARFRQAQLRPLSARHRAADRSRRKNARADADLDA